MSDPQERGCWAIICLVMIVVMFCVGAWVGKHDGAHAIRREAIEAGAAHYECDPQTGETRFVWGGKSE